MFAYLITNTVSGKCYVGITRGRVSARWRAHIRAAAAPIPKHARTRPRLQKAIAKYGADAFIVQEVLSVVPTGDRLMDWGTLCAEEQRLIKHYGTFAPHGYNLTRGGEGCVGHKKTARQLENSRSPEAREKIAASRRGKSQPRGPQSPLYGIPKTPEHAQKIRDLANIRWADPKRRAHQAARMIGVSAGDKNGMFGRGHTPETRAKQSALAKARFADGMRHPMLGRKQTESARARMAEAWACRKKDPTYVNHWIGRKQSAETVNKMKARKFSEETRAKMRAAAKARIARGDNTMINVNGERRKLTASVLRGQS